MSEYPRVAVRAILIHENKLLLVNAYANGQSALMCPPGGGVEAGSSLPENLCREVFEETGLRIEVGAPCLVNEFHDPGGSFHQVDIYFRCSVIGSAEIDSNWQDTDRIVTDRRWVTAEELANVHHKPDSLGAVAFDPQNAITYDPLEPLVR
ncbi:NUDIX hydrolase [Sulfitobacter mediterraneus]|nr:NUDIX hydrolase [Sulfitobacter mediterraneus]MBM1556047.1 NUDIX hydrolase [Sulfitobacter mediterraneus]MBM1567915.1 NUDIX hydrolase [Sulfitobacter mediterraneus]MBM1571401.1 NUDIX hydrolase [Sulfitobacter mediterraneus]MBM1575189.1 NUDIX hydrolase [Sulfitobacter mediterraneus]MBM1579320.1 NUDIX hydrolase [Sulfitobacter mediterraneus]